MRLMESLPGESEASERLKTTSLRNFGAAPESETDDVRRSLPTYKFTIDDAPVPALYRYALTLIGCRARGPWEKVLWSIEFTHNDELCALVMQKFGLRLYLRTSNLEDEARATRSCPLAWCSSSRAALR